MDAHERTFGVRSLNGRITKFAKEKRLNRANQQWFGMGRPLLPEGRTAEWDVVAMARGMAPAVGTDSPAPVVDGVTVGNRSNGMMHFKVKKRISGDRLYNDRAPGELSANAQALVDIEIEDGLGLINNSIEKACADTLKGSLVVNSTTFPLSEVTFTLTHTVTTHSPSASWATPSTKIATDELLKLKRKPQETAGLLGRHALVTGKMGDYLLGNTEVAGLIKSQGGQQALATAAEQFGEGSMAFGDLRWHKNDAGYKPKGGSFTRFQADTSLILLPEDEDLRDVLGFALGYGLVPGPEVASIEQAADCVRRAPTRGYYGYAIRTKDAPGVEIVMGWVGLPVLLFPEAVTYMADVTTP